MMAGSEGPSRGANKPWDVYLNGKKIDRVYTLPGMVTEEVRRSLIKHDGYSNDIVVKPGEEAWTR